MPLVVPGLMGSAGSNSNNNNQQEDWMNKLVGKKLTDSASDNTVCRQFVFFTPDDGWERERERERERDRGRDGLTYADAVV